MKNFGLRPKLFQRVGLVMEQPPAESGVGVLVIPLFLARFDHDVFKAVDVVLSREHESVGLQEAGKTRSQDKGKDQPRHDQPPAES